MTRARVLAALGLWCGHTLVAVRLDAQGAPPRPPADSAFLLTAEDPARTPSPFIGNGRIGVVIPALGVGPTPSLAAGVFEHGPGDVPRIAAVPEWNGIGVFDGERWLETAPADGSLAAGAIQSYRQTIDMRTGTARTAYDWVNGPRRTQVTVETFVSRAAPSVAATRIQLEPHQAGRMRVRFALAGWPPPARLPLGTLERAEPSWGPAELWYPGHMVIRSRRATARPGLGSLTLSAAPEGRKIELGEAAEVRWSRELAAVDVQARRHG